MYCYTFIFHVRFKLTKFLFSFISLKASSKLTEEQIEGKQIQIFFKKFTFPSWEGPVRVCMGKQFISEN